MPVTDPDFNPTQNAQVATLKAGFIELEESIKANCPKGRRQSVALTHLETAAMFAVKSVFEP